MKIKKIIKEASIIMLVSCIFCLVSCKPTFNTPAPSKGSINPKNYIALGGSMTAGYADGALYNEAQINSFPNLIAGQLKLIGGGNFNQPLISPSSIGIGSAGNAPFKLGYSNDCLGVNSLGPIPAATTGDASALAINIFSSHGPFNNMGVPGVKVITTQTPGYANPFFTRMASNPSTASVLSDAQALNPTFFSALFMDDVLTYATNGAASDSLSSTAGVIGDGFDASFLSMINILTASGAKGIVGNIPDVTSFPFFTTIPWNGLKLTRQGQADSLNGSWPGLPFNFHVGNNAFLIADPSVPYIGLRQIKEGELILLNTPLDSIKCKNLGSLKPIANLHVLTANEIINIQNATIAYNQTIKGTADLKGLAFVDVASFFSRAKTGINYDGIALNTQFVTGGAFSLDGINLNPIGNALLANEFIKAINTTYGSTIPRVDVTKYRGIIFP